MLFLLGVIGVIDIVVLLKLHKVFGLLHFPESTDMPEADLPSVSICISARNETHAMTQCLERVVATEYPKLEVIVLDDGSRDDTSVLIQSFAHVGVRFIEGRPLPDGWLGKNYAQSVLAEEASGKIVFFMDVDTLIDRHTLTRAVTYMQQHGAAMLSVVPIRSDHWATSTLMTTMRHFWTLMRFRTHRPRAVSNAWLVDRQLLLDRLRADDSLHLSLQMETMLSRTLVEESKYRLVMSNAWLGLRFEKRWSSQVETSIRLLYPQCGRHITQVVGLFVVLGLVLTPYVVVFWQPEALLLVVIQLAVALYYLSHVWVRYRLVGALLLPVTIVQEMVLLALSAYRYNFGTITWKGRPIVRKGQVI